MTSNSALSQFADLSPQQRQLLFEKIRQKKLNNARRAISDEVAPASTNLISLSPHQSNLLQLDDFPVASNRIIEIDFTGGLDLCQLQQAINYLSQTYPILNCRFDRKAKQFHVNEDPTTATLTALAELPAAMLGKEIDNIRNELAYQSNDQHCLHIALVKVADDNMRLLMAVHPLLLDSHSLFKLGNQLLRYSKNTAQLQPTNPPGADCQHRYARWSSQMFEQKFLKDEWNRLAPKMMAVADSRLQIGSKVYTHSVQLDQDFINSYAPSNTKQWICDALNQCLYSWLSHHEITYWFSEPQLKDSKFENLLGFFPYYVPVRAQQDDNFDITRTLSNLHTRYSAVSEQLGKALCLQGSQVPLIHYHRFDVEDSNGESLPLVSVKHHGNGFMLSPFEIHVIEHGSGVNLDIHYDPERISNKQLNYLTNDLTALLKQEHENVATSITSLPEQLKSIWKNLLLVDSIEPHQSFFELGGHSLQVTELKFRIKQKLKLDLPISVLYELSTIEKLSSFILATHGNSLGWMPESDDLEEEEEGTL